MSIFNVLELDDRMRSLEDVFYFNEVTCSANSTCLILSI
jgi:hypothetical protein